MRAEMGKEPSRAPPSQLNLPPGFRFYPTDEELVVHYLCKKAACEPFAVPIIAEVELYKFDPWDLPERALFGEKEWYFFSPRDRKYPNGSRPNRAAGAGYWKATGTDKPISTMGGSKKVGVKKALVFYKGKAPKGVKTNWIMHEYRLADSSARSAKRKGSLRLDDWVLCRIYKKCSSAQKAASAKERSESSCLDEVLATLPEIDDRLNPLNGLQEDMEKPAGLGFYQEATQYSGGNSSDLTTYMQQQQQLQSKVNMTPAAMKIGYRKQEANDQGASSLDLSHPDSNGFSSRQHSPPESMQEEDSVESTFNSLASFPLNTSTVFPQSFYGLDVSLSTMLGQGAFAGLGESDFLFPTSDYTANNLHRAFSQPDRGSHLYWDSKVNFA